MQDELWIAHIAGTDDPTRCLLTASRYDKPHLVERYVHQGANVNVPDDDGEYPLHYAVRYHRPELVLFLLQNGAWVDSQQLYGQETPLVLSCRLMKFEIAHLLLDNNADPTLADGSRDNALLWSAYHNEVPLLTRCLDLGVDIYHSYCDGANALMWAVRQASLECAQILLSRMTTLDHQNRDGLNVFQLCKHVELLEVLLAWERERIHAVEESVSAIIDGTNDPFVISIILDFFILSKI